jgi:repressor LexA
MIADRIKNRRVWLNKTQRELAKLIGVSRQTVQKYESGIVTDIPISRLKLIAKHLNTTLYDLMIDELFEKEK